MILKITKVYLIEQFRNKAILFANLMTPILFIIFAAVLNRIDFEEENVGDIIIKGQFISFSVLIVIFLLAFSSSVLTLTEKKENGTFSLLNRTDLKLRQYFLGTGIGVFILLNICLIIVLTAFSFIVDIEWNTFITLIFTGNFVLLALFPLSYIVASFFKSSKTANGVLVPVMLILMFSVTMLSLFATLMGKDPHNFYIYLVWNPMLFLNDIMQYEFGLAQDTWLPIYQYFLILTVLCVVFSFIANKTFKVNRLRD